MAFSSWLCTNSTRNMLLKIVHPGGHVELHDRPVLAAEIMLRNPGCCVAYPHVFQQPWAIVAPDTMLMLGQKFYVVPISTIRKLQRVSLRRSPSSPTQEVGNGQSHTTDEEQKVEERTVWSCWLFVNRSSPRPPYTSLKQADDESQKPTNEEKDMEKDGCFSDDNCFICLVAGTKPKANGDESSSEEARSSTSSAESSETTTTDRTKDYARKGRRSPRRYSSLDNWQPSLESINEE